MRFTLCISTCGTLEKINNSPQPQEPQLPVNLPPWIQKGVPQYGRLKIEIEGKPRHFVAWFWEERIYFQDKECPRLIWATLEKWDETISLGEFWREAIRTRNIGRYTEIWLDTASNPLYRAQPYNVRLTVPRVLVRMLLDEHNGGIASLVNSDLWYRFEPYVASRVTRPHAWKPSIFSPRRHVKFAGRALKTIEDQLVREKVSDFQWEVWREGATYKPLHLLAMALRTGLVSGQIARNIEVRNFWKLFLKDLYLSPLIQLLPEMDIDGEISLYSNGALYVSYGVSAQVRVRLELTVDSAHEVVEAYMEIRDWLLGSLPRAQVEQLLAQVKLP